MLRYSVTRENREKVRALKRDANEPKSALIRLESRVREIDPRRANQLSNIIARLEAWQNSSR